MNAAQKRKAPRMIAVNKRPYVYPFTGSGVFEQYVRIPADYKYLLREIRIVSTSTAPTLTIKARSIIKSLQFMTGATEIQNISTERENIVTAAKKMNILFEAGDTIGVQVEGVGAIKIAFVGTLIKAV